ncbi:hypothetical protein GTP45_09670 [Pseudoduganella sp. FT55W]|uniref:Uncharacterized protein n=1 Tax=Duganella rivi TaxID=2666083 RepID=A0A7X4GQ68_9BURK|nr:hypothetical protein [Duganella rivi]MYM67096.1 hypothetical protein [Duganella rivi]
MHLRYYFYNSRDRNPIEISAGALKGDGSFSFGGYYNSNGSFGTDSYTSGAKHGSDLLVHALSVTLATPNEVSLVYSSATHSHLAYDFSGKLGAADTSSVGYDFGHLKIIGAPAVVAEVYHS